MHVSWTILVFPSIWTMMTATTDSASLNQPDEPHHQWQKRTNTNPPANNNDDDDDDKVLDDLIKLRQFFCSHCIVECVNNGRRITSAIQECEEDCNIVLDELIDEENIAEPIDRFILSGRIPHYKCTWHDLPGRIKRDLFGNLKGPWPASAADRGLSTTHNGSPPNGSPPAEGPPYWWNSVRQSLTALRDGWRAALVRAGKPSLSTQFPRLPMGRIPPSWAVL